MKNVPSTIEELAILIYTTMASKEDIAEVNTRLDRIETHLERVEKKVDGIEPRVKRLEEAVAL